MKRLPLLLALLGVLTPLAARADDGSSIAAEALFSDARTLSRAGRYAEACPKFAQSMKLDPAAGTALNLAECEIAIGKTASAWLAYRDATTLARRAGQSEREAFAHERANALEPKLCRLTITVAPGAPADQTIHRGSEVVERAAWGIAVPVDPGGYAVSADAPGHHAFSRNVDVTAPTGDAPCAPQTITIPVLAALVGAPPPPAASTSGWRGAHTLAVGLGAAGVAALVVSGVFALHANSENSDGKNECQGGCSQDGKDKIVAAGHSADVATGVFIAGAVLVTAGVVTWLLSPPLHRGSHAALVIPSSIVTF